MAIWETTESCVRDLKTFRAMPWSSKLMYLSFVLVPAGITWIAYLKRTDGQGDARYWGWMAVLFWLGYAQEIPTYVRGYYAERRGIAPAPPGKRPNFESMKRSMVVLGVLVCVLTLLFCFGSIHFTVHHPRAPWWSDILLGVVLFFQSLSTYTRSRYWNAELT